MSKAEILQELPRVGLQERREILERICELEESELLGRAEPTAEEKRLLDREWEDYQQNPEAGPLWHEVRARIGKPPTS